MALIDVFGFKGIWKDPPRPSVEVEKTNPEEQIARLRQDPASLRWRHKMDTPRAAEVRKGCLADRIGERKGVAP